MDAAGWIDAVWPIIAASPKIALLLFILGGLCGWFIARQRMAGKIDALEERLKGAKEDIETLKEWLDSRDQSIDELSRNFVALEARAREAARRPGIANETRLLLEEVQYSSATANTTIRLLGEDQIVLHRLAEDIRTAIFVSEAKDRPPNGSRLREP